MFFTLLLEALNTTTPKYIKVDLQYIIKMVLDIKSLFFTLAPVFTPYKSLKECLIKAKIINLYDNKSYLNCYYFINNMRTILIKSKLPK